MRCDLISSLSSSSPPPSTTAPASSSGEETALLGRQEELLCHASIEPVLIYEHLRSSRGQPARASVVGEETVATVARAKSTVATSPPWVSPASFSSSSERLRRPSPGPSRLSSSTTSWAPSTANWLIDRSIDRSLSDLRAEEGYTGSPGDDLFCFFVFFPFASSFSSDRRPSDDSAEGEDISWRSATS
mmetsp:Transcript_14599/g.25493  ORF Transcript_14599/g.25493 Transcript_14599/m.25493 type:complete len:188 (+) Transcript_14599:278-841(+)